jgi:hypothetical protein
MRVISRMTSEAMPCWRRGSPLPAIRASAGTYSAKVVRFDAMPPAPARKDPPMLGGFASVLGARGVGGRTNARSPTATSRTPKPRLIAALSVSLVEKPVSPTRTPIVLTTMRTTAAPPVRADPRAIGRSPVKVFSCSRKMTGLIAAPRASGMTSRSRLLTVRPDLCEAGTRRPPKQTLVGPTRICCATTGGET